MTDETLLAKGRAFIEGMIADYAKYPRGRAVDVVASLRAVLAELDRLTVAEQTAKLLESSAADWPSEVEALYPQRLSEEGTRELLAEREQRPPMTPEREDLVVRVRAAVERVRSQNREILNRLARL